MATGQWTCSDTLPVNYAADSGGDGSANPGDSHLPIGKWDPGTGLTWSGRALFKAPINFAGMTAINEARLYFRAHWTAGWHAHGTSVASLHAARKTADWNEASGGSTGTDEIWGGSYSYLVSTDFAAVEFGDEAANLGNLVEGTWYYAVITQIVRRWFEGQPNYGILVFNATSGANAAYAKEFYSRRVGGSEPYIWIDYATNTAPNAPTGLSPTGSAVVHTGTTITYSGTRSDPDGGDYITAVQILLYLDDGTTLIDDWTTYPGGTPTSFSIGRSLPGGRYANAYYRWAARTRDSAGVWGAYSAQQRFKANTVPNMPSTPTVPTNTLTPSISGGFSDPDPGDSLAAIQIWVILDASPFTTMWDSGEVAKSGSTWAQTYAGSALSWGTAYRAVARTKDANGGWSEWSPWSLFTPTQPTGPDNCSPVSTASKQNTLTPTLTIGHSANFRNDQLQVRSAPAGGGTLLWDKVWDGADYAATASKARTYAGSALAWGSTYWWRTQAELDPSGNITAWTDWFPFYINAQPTAPTVTVANAVVSGTGVRVVTDSTPDLTCLFADPDKAPYGDAPSARRIEIRRKSDQVALSGYPVTTGTTETHTVATALTINTEYEVRWGYRDNAGEPAGSYVYSAWLTIKYSALPTVTVVDETGVTLATSAASDDIIDTASPHGYAVGNVVRFTALTGGAGLSTGVPYYVVATSLGSTTFRVASTPGGTPLGFTTDITAGTVVRQGGPVSPVVESTPVVDWTYAGSGGKAQYSYLVRVFDKGPTGALYPNEQEVYSSGEIISTATQHQIPDGELVNEHDYRWAVAVKDTDLLSYELT